MAQAEPQWNPEAEITPQWQMRYEDLTEWVRIGGGNFGNVFRAKYQDHVVAVKQLINPDADPAHPEDDDMGLYYQREMATLKELKHPNVLRLLGLCKHEGTLYIITEFVEGGDLRRHLKNMNLKLSWHLRVRIALDCADAMAYLHANSFLHRDFKSKNLLVGPNWRVKVADFGFARKMANQNEFMTLCGTDEWMAPEVMLGEKYDEKADVYSFGMVLVEIITRAKPLERANASAPYDYEKFKMMTPPSCPYELFKICILCSQFYPINRPTIFEVYESLLALDKALEAGPVKSIADIQAEMALAALQAQNDSDDDGQGSGGGSSDDGPASSDDEDDGSGEGAAEEKLTVRVEQIREQAVQSVPTLPDAQAGDTLEARVKAAAEVVAAAPPPQRKLGSQRFVRAKRDYQGADGAEMSFRAGEEIMFGATDESGWVFGTIGGKSGWFPRDLVEEVPLEGAKPLFKDAVTPASPVDSTPLKKELAANRLSVGLTARPSFGELEQKGIIKPSAGPGPSAPAVDMKEKKLTLNMLFKRPNKGGAAAAPVELSLSEEQLDALILKLADDEGGPGWSKGKKLLTLKSFDNVCQGTALLKWLLDKEITKEEKEGIVLLEHMLARGALRDPAKGKKAFEKGTMYQLCLLLTPVEGQVTVLNAGKLWGAGGGAVLVRDAAELAVDIARKTEKFFKPTPADLQSVSADARFRALVLEAAEFQAVDPVALSHKARQVFFVNLHNALWLHAKAWLGAPRSMLERKRITDLCAFNVGGQLYTPHLILDGLLRALPAVLPESDPRYTCVCKVADALQLLSLSDGTLSHPRHRVYVESSWMEDLRQNVAAWFTTKGVVICFPNSNEIQLPRIFKTWLDSFGGTTNALMAVLHDVLPKEVRGFLQDVKAAKAELSVSFMENDDTSW